MLKDCSNAGDRYRSYRGIDSDMQNGNCNKVVKENGDEIFCMDSKTVWLADAENKQWISQKDGSVVPWI